MTTQMRNVFVYGSLTDLEILGTVIGKNHLEARPAVLEGFQLAVQRLDQVPDVATIPGVPDTARGILREKWPPDFESYILKSGEGKVKGLLVPFDEGDLAAVEDWELVDFDWQQRVEGNATAEDGSSEKVVTLALSEGQEVDRVVDGMNYDPYLGKGPAFRDRQLAVAREARAAFLERTTGKEGSSSLKERQ